MKNYTFFAIYWVVEGYQEKHHRITKTLISAVNVLVNLSNLLKHERILLQQTINQNMTYKSKCPKNPVEAPRF